MLPRPADLPTTLTKRYEHVAARLAELPALLPPELRESAVRVAVVSDFVLGVLLRHPQVLVERLGDPARLDAAAIRARLRLESATEAQAMTALREMRQIEMARIAWRDIAGLATLEGTLADVSLLAECLIDAAASFAAAQL